MKLPRKAAPLLSGGMLILLLAIPLGAWKNPDGGNAQISSLYFLERERAQSDLISGGISSVLQLLFHPRYLVREVALNAMECFDQGGEEELRKVYFHDPEPSLRKKAGRILALRGEELEGLKKGGFYPRILDERIEEILDEVGSRIMDSNDEVKGFYDTQFEEITQLGKESLPSLIRILRSRSYPLRWKVLAICALGELKDPAALETLRDWGLVFQKRLSCLEERYMRFKNLHVIALYYPYMLESGDKERPGGDSSSALKSSGGLGITREGILSFFPRLSKEKHETEEVLKHLSYALARLGDPALVLDRIKVLKKKLNRIAAEVSRIEVEEGGDHTTDDDMLVEDLVSGYFQIAYEYHQILELEKAEQYYTKAIETEETFHLGVPSSQVACYNLACLKAEKGLQKEALKNLEKALQKGFLDFSWIEQDGDLDTIRNLPEFQELLKRWRK